MPQRKTADEQALAQLFGAKLKAARTATGRTQRWVGEQAQVSYQQIQAYERGSALPPIARARLIVRLFNADIDAWLRSSPAPGVAEPASTFLDERSELLAIYDRLPRDRRAELLEAARLLVEG